MPSDGFRDPFRPDHQIPHYEEDGGDGGNGGTAVTVSIEFGADPADITLTITSQAPTTSWTVDWDDALPESTITEGVVATHRYLTTAAGTQYSIVVTTEYGAVTQPLEY